MVCLRWLALTYLTHFIKNNGTAQTTILIWYHNHHTVHTYPGMKGSTAQARLLNGDEVKLLQEGQGSLGNWKRDAFCSTLSHPPFQAAFTSLTNKNLQGYDHDY